MKLYWSFIVGDVQKPLYVATEIPLDNGTRIEFRDTVGMIEKQEDGSWSVYSTVFNFLDNTRTKKFAMNILERYVNNKKEG